MLGGKGGVGKTSSAASLGVRMGSEGGPTLVVSTDPAHSLSDSLDQVSGLSRCLDSMLPLVSVMAFAAGAGAHLSLLVWSGQPRHCCTYSCHDPQYNIVKRALCLEC